MQKVVKHGKFLLITAALLIAAALSLAAFGGAFSVDAFGAYAADGETDVVVDENSFEGGYADEKATRDALGALSVSDSDTGYNSDFNSVANVSLTTASGENTVEFSLGGLLSEAAGSHRLRAEIIAVGSIRFTGTSSGAEGTTTSYSLSQRFTVGGAMQAANVVTNESGVAESGGYEHNVTYTMDDPLSVTNGYINADAGGSITVDYISTFAVNRTMSGVTQSEVTAESEVALDYYIRFDFQEVVVTVSLNGENYGKVVDGDYGALYDEYASALATGGAANYGSLDELPAVENGGSIEYGLTDNIVFTAIPAQNAIFEYWTVSGAQTRAKTVDLGSAAGVVLDNTTQNGLQYQARFRNFNVSSATYTYNGTSQGPSVTDNTITQTYALTTYFTGTDNAGGTHAGSGYPTYAGEYVFAAAAAYTADGEYAGAVSVEFVIARRAVAISLTTGTEYTVNFGETLSAAGVAASVSGYDAGQRVDGTEAFYHYVNGALGSAAADNAVAELAEPGRTYTFAYTFTPTGDDANNYEQNYVPITVEVVSGFGITAVGGTEGIDYDYEFAVSGEAGSETITLTLTAEAPSEPNRFFMGWRHGELEYLTAGADGLSYVHTVRADAENRDELLTYAFVAVFTSAPTYAPIAYTGAAYSGFNAQNILARMSAGSSYGAYIDNIGFSPAGGSADSATATQPVAIGSYVLYFDIYNSLFGYDESTGTATPHPIGTAAVPFEITRAALSVQTDLNASMEHNYNVATGWSRQMVYTVGNTLSVRTGTEIYYYYRFAGDTEWLEGGSAGAAAASVSFTTPLTYGGTDVSLSSAVIEYMFVAVNEENGAVVTDPGGAELYGGRKVVALSSGAVTAKLDNFVPKIVSVVPIGIGTGEAWARSMSFEITVVYGGSGIELGYYERGLSGSAAWMNDESVVVVGDTGVYGYSSGFDTEPVTATFGITVAEGFSGYMSFAARGATRVLSEFDLETQINIDATAPVITVVSAEGKIFPEGGWYSTDVTVEISVTDEGGSGAEELQVRSDAGGTEGITWETIADGRYRLVISASNAYTLSVLDGATNITTNTLQYNIEKQAPAATYAPGSVVGGGWTGAEGAAAIFTVTGAEGAAFSAPARLMYRTAGASKWVPATDFVPAENGAVTLSFANIIQGIAYEFYVEGANGLRSEVIDFAAVSFDDEAPVIVIETDLGPYTGETWVSERVPVRLRITDAGGAGIPWEDPEYVNGVFVTDKPNAEVALNADGTYTVYVDDCTEYEVVARDRAGNAASVAFTLKVDIVSPDLEVRANIGTAGGAEYTFGEWVTDGSDVVVSFTFGLTASGTRVQYATGSNSTWINITDTPLYPAPGEYTGTGTAEFVLPGERNTGYRFRVVTGSGRVFEATPEVGSFFVVCQDNTAPILGAENFVSGTDVNYPVTERWSAENVTWRFLPSDGISGVGTIALYRLPAETAEWDIEGMLLPENKVSLSSSGGYYIYELSEYALYVLRITDNAGNAFTRAAVRALIDKTSGFSGSAAVTLNTADGAPVESGSALTNASDVAFITVTVSGIDAFGPSGARAEYSVDGGENWLTAEGYEEYTAALTQYLSIGFDGVYGLMVRVVTGAGAQGAVTFDGEETFGYNKDASPITIEIYAYTLGADGAEEAYNGEWTNRDVYLWITVVSGAYGGVLYIGSGSDPVTIPANSVTFEYTHAITENFGATLTVTYDSLRPGADNAAQTVDVRIDKTAPVIEVSASGGSGAVANGGYGWGDITFTASVSATLSGISVVEYSLGGEWIRCDTEPYAYTWSGGVTGDSLAISFRVKSNSGNESVTEAFEVVRDETEAPTAAPEPYGEKAANEVDGEIWYLDIDSDSDGERDGLRIGYKFDSVPVSGLIFEYSYTLKGEIVSGRKEAVFEAGFVGVTLYDLSAGSAEKGGTVYENFTYSWITGAGKSASASGAGTVYRIDGNVYTVSLTVSAAGIEQSSDYAFVTEISGFGEYHKGEYAKFSFAAADGYRFRSYSAGGINENYAANDPLAAAAKEGSYTIAGDYAVSAEMYVEVAYEFQGLEQYIQSSRTPVGPVLVCPEEISALFGDRFSTWVTPLGELGIDIASPYGTYPVTASFEGDYSDTFVFVTETESGVTVSQTVTETLRIAYFTGLGTTGDPFTVGSAEDFEMIAAYTATYSTAEEEERYDLAFGSNRKSAHFEQTADFAIDTSFTPVAVFSGTYNGAGHVISAEELDISSGGFALFTSISSAAIYDLGVTISALRMADASDSKVSFLAGYVEGNSNISGVFVAGNAYLGSASSVTFGGIAAHMTLTQISSSFSMINVWSDGATGYVGGIVGRSEGIAYTSASYALGTITADGSLPYDVASEGEYLMAGAIAGYADTALQTSPSATYYMDGAVSYGGAGIYDRPLGNHEAANILDTLNYVSVDGIEGFTDMTAAFVGERSVPELIALAAAFLASGTGTAGTGTALDPFVIGDANDFTLVALAPWAYFIQNANIEPGEWAVYLSVTPFRGFYDGAGYALDNVAISGSNEYSGLFRTIEGTVTDLKITNISARFTPSDGGYAGAVAAEIAASGRIENVVVTGELALTAPSGTVYAGAVAGIVSGSVTDVVANVAVSLDIRDGVIGGVFGQVRESASAGYVTGIGSLNAEYSGRIDVGAFAGSVVEGDSVQNSVFLSAHAFAGGMSVTRAYRASSGAAQGVTGEAEYQSIAASSAYNSAGLTISSIMSGLYPFAGSGTSEDPFVITDFGELIGISSYMYADFVLANDIVAGDFDGDGRADGTDYAFEPIGGEETFTGSLNGAGYRIIGLTDSLFTSVAGTVRRLGVTVDYSVNAEGDVTFGAIARELKDGALLVQITVSGTVEIVASGLSEVVAGGIAGVVEGGSIRVATAGITFRIRGMNVIAGGIAGVIENMDNDYAATWTPDGAASLDAGGATVNAGIYVGMSSAEGAAEWQFKETTASLTVNGAESGAYIGKIPG